MGQAAKDAHKKLNEHEQLKREKARLEKKLEEDKIKIAIARKAMEDAKKRAEEEARQKLLEEERLKSVEESIDKLHAAIKEELSLTSGLSQEDSSKEGATVGEVEIKNGEKAGSISAFEGEKEEPEAVNVNRQDD